ncbi:polysaccharide deacetylase family protein [Labilibaculum antarcticum]|nr:DUF4163 domain-containing protein [Labilibaculum antarcticum]
MRRKRNSFLGILILWCVLVMYSCRNDLSIIVHEKEISKRIENGLLTVKFPELKNNSRDSRNVCDSINSNVELFLNSLLYEMDLDENHEVKSESRVCNRELKIDYTLDVFARDYVSARFTVYSYQGGEHGQTFFKCFNYSTQRAEQLKLDDLLHLKRKKELQSLNKLLIKYFENPDHCFNELPFIAADFQFFSYQDDCFIFSFSDNSLGDYVCGTAEIKIPIWDLKQHGLWKL